jgi:solute carrier family 39 (zinc transporter), member 1/2/3
MSNAGALFPILAKRSPRLRIPSWVFFSVKHFGTGVIIATAFIHVFPSLDDADKLLPSAFESLTSPCLPAFFTTRYPSLAGLITMVSILVIFFVEFASSRYLAHIDEHVLNMQLNEAGNHSTLIEPITSFLTRQNIIIRGKRIDISSTIANEAAERAIESIISRPRQPDETSPLLNHVAGETDGHGPTRPGELRKSPSLRRDSHCGHHHYDPPPPDGSECECPDVTRDSQLLAVAIMEGGLCFHSIFVGLTLAVATGSGFVSLLTAIMFHRSLLLAELT